MTSIGEILGNLHHIAVVTGSVAETSNIYRDMGYSITDRIFDPVQDVFICFAEKHGCPRIELIEPASDSSPVSKILAKSGVTPYHFCYEVNNVDEAILSLKNHGFILISKPVNAVAMDNRLICFCYNKSFGLIELVQF